MTGERIVYIARALRANFPILSLFLYSLLQHQSQVRDFPPFSFTLSGLGPGLTVAQEFLEDQ